MKNRFYFFLIAIPTCMVLAGCANSDKMGWYVINPMLKKGRINIEFLLSGVGWTIALTIACVTLAFIIGFAVSLAGISESKPVQWAYRIYVEVFRSIPPLVSILWVYYGLPVLMGADLNPFASATIALSLYGSGFIAEIIRGGVQSVAKGQFEAADSVGLTRFDKLRYVVLPQAIRRSLPALGNQVVIMLKMSSLAAFIGVAEVVRRANELSVTEYRPLEIYTFLVLEYLVLVLVVSWGIRRLEKRLGADERHAGGTPAGPDK